MRLIRPIAKSFRARKVHGNQAIGVSRGGKNTKINALVNEKMELLSFILTGGEVFDSKVAIDLLKTVDITEKTLLADRAYGASAIRDYICKKVALSCIPDKVNSKIIHSFDKEVLICFWNFIVLAAIKMKLQ